MIAKLKKDVSIWNINSFGEFYLQIYEKYAKDYKAAMDKFKTEVASELGVNLKEGYNGDLTSREAGSIGGEMVRRMVKSYEESIK